MSKNVTVKGVHTLKEGAKLTLHDLQISASDSKGVIKMVDFEMEETNNTADYVIKAGCWKITANQGLIGLDIPDEAFFETTTSKNLLDHFMRFKNKVGIYKKYNRPPKRCFLFGSIPGCGKSSLIRYFCRQIKSEPNVCILRVDSGEVSWETISAMFMREYTGKIDLVVLIIEDIGGTELNERGNRVDSSMLNFLDGNTDCIKVPTLVIATTNFINELGSRLTDRPGRFNLVEQVEPPKDSEIMCIVENFLKRKLTKEEATALCGQELTPDYAVDAIIRTELYDISIKEAVEQLLAQRKKSRESSYGTKKKGPVGFVSDDDSEFEADDGF